MKLKLSFFASLMVNDEQYDLQPFNKDVTLVYKKITINIDEAYNPDPGIYPLDRSFNIILKGAICNFCVNIAALTLVCKLRGWDLANQIVGFIFRFLIKCL